MSQFAGAETAAVVSLRPITQDNLREILRLKVAPEQEQFVASNAISLAQAHFYREAWYRAIYADETPVGFLMVSDDPVAPEYFLWRLMIDQRYQGQGLGYRAVGLLIDYVKTRPGAAALLVSHGEGEGNPGPFYRKLGFEYTGDVHEGELVMRLPLGVEMGEAVSQPMVPAAGSQGPLTHLVLFKLKDRNPDAIARAVEVLRSLEGKITELRAIEVGSDVVKSQRSYDIGLITRFDNLADMEAYQVHPVHQDVLTYMRTAVESSISVDFVG